MLIGLVWKCKYNSTRNLFRNYYYYYYYY